MVAVMLTACGGGAESGEAVADQGVDSVQQVDKPLALPPKPAASPSERLGTIPKGDGPHLTWDELKDVEFEERFYEEVDQLLLFPKFGQSILDKEGKSFIISGYVIPVSPGDGEEPPLYVLSANPFSACFFCGNAGPESVMELELNDPFVLYATDEFRSFKGTFRLNDSNIDRLNYILEEADLY